MWNVQLNWRGPNVEAAELAVELEDLLHHVWRCERSWHLDDRLDAAARAAAGKQGL